MKKQIQFAIFRVYGVENQSLNENLREQLEAPLNNGWELNGWQVIGSWGVDEMNNPVVNVMICLTRTLEEWAEQQAKFAEEILEEV